MSSKKSDDPMSTALKAVYNLHGNQVAGLKAELDLALQENQSLKAQLQTSSVNIASMPCMICPAYQTHISSLQKQLNSGMKDKDKLIKLLQSRLKALGEDIAPGLSGTVDQYTVFTETEDLSEQTECTERFKRRTNVSSRYSTAKTRLSQQNNRTGSIGMIETDQTSTECAASEHLSKGDNRLNNIDKDSKEKPITEKISHNTLVPPYKDKRDMVSATKNHNKADDTLDQLIQQDGNDNHNKDSEVYNGKQYEDNQVCSTKTDRRDSSLQLDPETACISSSHKSEETPFSFHKPENSSSQDESSKQTNSKLQLPRQRKRRSRYKEHADAKKQRMSPNSDKNARLKGFGMDIMQNTETQVVGQSILVPETEMVTKYDDSNVDEDSDNLLVIPESMAFEADSDRDDWLKEKVDKTPILPVMPVSKTPATESPRIFDDVKVGKHIPGTPYRNTGVNLNRKRPSKSSNSSQLLRNRNEEENSMKENQSPRGSLRQSTLTQAFSDGTTEKFSAEEMKRKEEDDVAKAIHRSLQDSVHIRYASVSLGGSDENEEDDQSSQESTLVSKESTQIKITQGDNSPNKKESTRNKYSLKIKERSPNIPKYSLGTHESDLKIVKKDLFTPHRIEIGKETKKNDLFTPHRMEKEKETKKNDVFTPHRVEIVKETKKKDLTPKRTPLFAKKKLVVSSASDERNFNNTATHRSAKDYIKLTECSSKNDETIAPYLLGDNPSIPIDSLDFSLPSLRPFTKHEAELSRSRNDKADLGGFDKYDDDDKDSTDNEEEDEETIAPSPQNSMLCSQLGMSSSSRSFQFKKIPKPLITKTDLNQKNKSNMKNNSKEEVSFSRPSSTDNSSNHQFKSVKCMDVNIIEEQIPDQTLFDSFDRLPLRNDEGYAHVKVVRKQSERQKLQGFSCKECEDFYKNSGKSESEIQHQMQQCSRHRDTFPKASTPEHFWSLGFPDTCDDTVKDPTQAITPRPRRRVKLAKKF